MKQIEELIERYSKNDIHLFFEDGGLCYNAPKGAMTEEMLLELSTEKKQIIDFIMGKNLSMTEIIPAMPIEKKENIPMSFSQEQLWVLNRLEGIGSAYNMMSVFRLKGTFNISMMHKAFNEIVKHHEILRSVYPVKDGEPVVFICDDVSSSLQIKDFTLYNEEERLTKAKEWVNYETQIPFDLQTGPLFRLSLGVLDVEDHLLVISIHHIISDGWSMGVLFNELVQLYNSYLSKTSVPLLKLPIQYYDYSFYQRKRYGELKYQSSLEYWEAKLAGAQHFLRLPTDYPRPVIQSFQGKTLRFTINKEIAAQLKAFSNEQGLTLYMTLLSLFGTLMFKYSGQEDIIIGAPMANRNNNQLSGLIGFLVNTLPIHFDFSNIQTFNQLFSMTKEEVLGAFAHQEIPLGLVVDQIKPERNPSYSPLVQVLFVLQNNETVRPSFTGLEAEDWQIDIKTSKMDLTLMITEDQKGLLCEWEFNTGLFKEETMLQMAECFERLCEYSVLNLQNHLRYFPLLCKKDFDKVVTDWNQTGTHYPRESTVHELFEEQVNRHPDAIALICNDEIMTYAELNQKAGELKSKLLSMGLQKQEAVGVCIKRSFDLIVALLAILKAGGVYVPLDAEYPKKRIAYMIDDSKINILLTEQDMKESIPLVPKHVICLDRAWNEAFSVQGEKGHSVNAEDTAYIIYTSGSTGEPKGIMVPHRGINRLVKNTNYVQILPKDVFFQGAPVSFDAATFEIWGALLNGGRLVLPPPHTLTLKEIGNALLTHKVTILWLTAGLFHLMVDNRFEDLKGIKQLIAGGDVLSVSHVKKVLQNIKGCVLINGYGPTENTTFSCCYPMTKEEEVGRSVSIGKPISNSQAYIMDTSLQPVPLGMSGELYLGGDGLATGYLNRPDLTKERFIPNPFSSNPQEKLYRTGDLARFLPDGNIEFLGRMDNQVKIRGFRIEIQEIEAAIASYPEVKEVVVVCKDDVQGVKELVAYIVPKTEKADQCSTKDITRHVAQWLPSYMHPGKYILLGKLPLDPNGKVDRKALPDWEPIHEVPMNTINKTITQEKLIEISRKILNKEDFKPEDNFFEKGVNSLSIIRFISEIEEVFDIALTIGDFMELPNLQKVASKIDSLLRNEEAVLEKALPEIAGASHLSQEANESFLFSTQDKLIEISRKILNKEGLKPEDNFFEKGVNSLAIIRFISEIEEVFNITLTIGDFMELPNLQNVALKIDSLIRNEDSVVEKVESSCLSQAANESFLSSAQKQLWYLEQVEDIKSTYNIATVKRLKGVLNLQALRESIYQLSCRHESLRTTFTLKEGVPVQKVHLPQAFELKVIDLRTYYAKEQQNQIAKIIQDETQRKFNLNEYPLWQFVILQLQQRESIMIFTTHHIIFDGWSMGIFFTELSELYKNYRAGKNAFMEPVTLQYKDFAERQRKYLESEAIHKHILYWKEKLKNVPSLLHLPIDKPRPCIQTFSGKTVVFDIPNHTSSGLKALNKKAESMMFMTALTTFAVFLARWCDVDDLVIGVPVANRNKKDMEASIGYFVNVLPIRIRLKENPTFLHVLRQVRTTILEAYEHQELPLEMLVKELKPKRDPAYSPLFQTMFHLYNRDSENLSLSGLEVEDIEIENPTSKLDLLLTITETDSGLLGDWEYNTDLFEDQTIEKLTQQFLSLLDQVVSQPEIRLLQIDFRAGLKKSQQVLHDCVKGVDLETGHPYTKTVFELLQMSKKVFMLEELKPEDNLFEKGVDSLTIIRFIAEIENVYGVALRIRDFMQSPSIFALTLKIDGSLAKENILAKIQNQSSYYQRGKKYILSYAQKQLWFLEQIVGMGSTYNIASAMKLKGYLNKNALERSIHEIVCRHESLRTTFNVKEGTPVQTIYPPQPFSLRVIDLSQYLWEEQQDQIQKIIENENQRHFDLTEYPLWRFFTIKLEEQQHIILFVVHHIIFDGWSMGIFFSELSALYEGYGHGKDILLEPIRLQYKDFADRQQQYLESVGIDKHIVYWKEKLGQVPSFIPLPVDKARPSVQTFCGKTIEFQIPEDMYIQLKALNDKEESMMLMTTLTAYAALLTRVCCINDMVIGVPVADRTKKDYESVIGYFVNIVPIRVFIKDNPTFINMLAQVKETVLDAYDHQELPFEKLVELLKLPRNPSYSPLIQTMFHFHNQAQERLQLWDLVVENMDIDNHTSKFDLMLTLMETEKGLLGYWEYNTDLFEENTIHEFTGSLLELVRQITENPQMRINLVMEFKNQDQMVKPEFLPEADYPLTETELKLIEIFEAIFSKSHLKREDDFYSLGGHSLLIIQLISDIEKSFLMDLSVMDIMTNPMIGSLASVIDGMMNGK